MKRNHQVRSKITIIFMSLGACTYNFELFFLHYCVKACPCVYQTILTIKSNSPIHWFFLSLEIFADQIYRYSKALRYMALSCTGLADTRFIIGSQLQVHGFL